MAPGPQHGGYGVAVEGAGRTFGCRGRMPHSPRRFQLGELADRLEEPSPVAQEARGDPGPFEQRPTGAADVLQPQRGSRHGPPEVIAVVRLALDRRAVAEPFALLISVRRKTSRAKRRLFGGER
jgi:hypothetical protein